MIQGNAELARQDVPAESSVRPFLEQIDMACRRAAGLCRPDAGLLRAERVPHRGLRSGRMVSDMADLLRHTLPPHAHLELQLQPKLPSFPANTGQVRRC